MIELLQPDFEFENECGKLTQLVRDGWKQVNVITSKAGSKRGGHYHKYNEEAFFVVSGSFLLQVFQDGNQEEHEFRAGDMFKIHKNVAHTFLYHEDTVLVGMYDKGVELTENEKDIWVL